MGARAPRHGIVNRGRAGARSLRDRSDGWPCATSPRARAGRRRIRSRRARRDRREDVDRQPVGDVLVGRLLPREAVAVQRDDVLQQRERGQVRQVAVGIGDVELEAATHLAACHLWNVGWKSWSRSTTPGSRRRANRARKRGGVEPGRAPDLERARRAAALREVGALEQHLARVDRARSRASACSVTGSPRAGRCRRTACVGASRPSGSTVRSQRRRAGTLAEARVHEPRHLAQREAVAHRHGVEPDERLVAGRMRLPSITWPPIGFGRSSTTTAFPAAAHASSASAVVHSKV